MMNRRTLLHSLLGTGAALATWPLAKAIEAKPGRFAAIGKETAPGVAVDAADVAWDVGEVGGDQTVQLVLISEDPDEPPLHWNCRCDRPLQDGDTFTIEWTVGDDFAL